MKVSYITGKKRSGKTEQLLSQYKTGDVFLCRDVLVGHRLYRRGANLLTPVPAAAIVLGMPSPSMGTVFVDRLKAAKRILVDDSQLFGLTTQALTQLINKMAPQAKEVIYVTLES